MTDKELNVEQKLYSTAKWGKSCTAVNCTAPLVQQRYVDPIVSAFKFFSERKGKCMVSKTQQGWCLPQQKATSGRLHGQAKQIGRVPPLLLFC